MWNLYEYTTHYATIETETYSLLAGIKKEFTPEAMDFFHAYLSGGAMALHYENEFTQVANGIVEKHQSGDDWCYGGWLEAGFYFTAFKNMNLGACYRYSKAESDSDMDYGGSSMNLILGYRF